MNGVTTNEGSASNSQREVWIVGCAAMGCGALRLLLTLWILYENFSLPETASNNWRVASRSVVGDTGLLLVGMFLVCETQ